MCASQMTQVRLVYLHEPLLTAQPVTKLRSKPRLGRVPASKSPHMKHSAHAYPLRPVGRFVCNYIYFLSLREAAAHPGWHALFVHVPAFAVVGESVQRTFLVRLLRGIAELPQLQTPSLAAIANSVADEEPLSVTAVSKLGEKEAQGPGQHAALVWTASAAAVTYLASMN